MKIRDIYFNCSSIIVLKLKLKTSSKMAHHLLFLRSMRTLLSERRDKLAKSIADDQKELKLVDQLLTLIRSEAFKIPKDRDTFEITQESHSEITESSTTAKASCSSDPLAKGRNHPLRNTEVCKHWQKGYCKFGDQCNFLHPCKDQKYNSCQSSSNYTCDDQPGLLTDSSGLLFPDVVSKLMMDEDSDN